VQALGLVLALAGSSYATWGAFQFDPRGDPTAERSFDRPIGRISQLLARYRAALHRLSPETKQEQLLLSELDSQTRITAAVSVLLLRIFIGTLVGVAGLICLTISVERHRLLVLIETLRR
jgi:hypothetical protein